MTETETQTFGSYFQNFFLIHLNFTIDFERPNEYDCDEKLGTFIHEYIHFLQNISTTFGVKGLVCNFARIEDYIYKIYTSKDIKVSNNPKLSDDISAYYELYAMSRGDFDDIIYKPFKEIQVLNIPKFKKDECFNECFDGRLKEEWPKYLPPLLNLKLIDKDNNVCTKSLYFGAILIMESMAALFETHIYPQHFRYKQISYDICTIIWNYFIPESKDRFDLIFAACDASLMDVNPGMAFIIVLAMYKNRLNSIDKIYNAFSETFWPPNMQSYKELVSELEQHLNKLIPKDNEFYKPLNEYVTEFVNTLYKLRTEKISFLSERMCKDKLNNKEWLSNFVNNKKAVPVIIDSNNKIFLGFSSEENKSNMIYFLALFAFSNLFGISGKKKRYLSDICKSEYPNNYNEDCEICPWKKGRESILCPMGQIWHTFQIKNKELIYNTL